MRKSILHEAKKQANFFKAWQICQQFYRNLAEEEEEKKDDEEAISKLAVIL
jgi:hypothetical protein